MPKRKTEDIHFEDDGFINHTQKVRHTQKKISWRSPLTFSPQIKFSPNLSFSKCSTKDSNPDNDTFTDTCEPSPLSKEPKALTVNIHFTPKQGKSIPTSQKTRTFFPLKDQAYGSPGEDNKENVDDKIDTFSDLCGSSIIDNISLIRNARIHKKKMQQQNTSVTDYYSQLMPENVVEVHEQNDMQDAIENQETGSQIVSAQDQNSFELENSQISDNLTNLENSQCLFPSPHIQDYNDNLVSSTSFGATQLPHQMFYNQQTKYTNLDQNQLSVTMSNNNEIDYFKQNRMETNTMMNNSFVPSRDDGTNKSNIRFDPQTFQGQRQVITDNVVLPTNHYEPRIPAVNQSIAQYPLLTTKVPPTEYDCSQYFPSIDPSNYATKKPMLQNLKTPMNMQNFGYKTSTCSEQEEGSEKFPNMNHSFYNAGTVNMAPRIPMNVVNQNSQPYPMICGNGNASFPMTNYSYNQESVNNRQFQDPTVFQNMNQSIYFEPTPNVPPAPSINQNQSIVFPTQTIYVRDSITGRIFEVPQITQNMNQSYFHEQGVNMQPMMPISQANFCQPFVASHQHNTQAGHNYSHLTCDRIWNAKPNTQNPQQQKPSTKTSRKRPVLPKVNDKQYVMNKFLNSLSESSFSEVN